MRYVLTIPISIASEREAADGSDYLDETRHEKDTTMSFSVDASDPDDALEKLECALCFHLRTFKRR